MWWKGDIRGGGGGGHRERESQREKSIKCERERKAINGGRERESQRRLLRVTAGGFVVWSHMPFCAKLTELLEKNVDTLGRGTCTALVLM
jgi:hypothetical protein